MRRAHIQRFVVIIFKLKTGEHNKINSENVSAAKAKAAKAKATNLSHDVGIGDTVIGLPPDCLVDHTGRLHGSIREPSTTRTRACALKQIRAALRRTLVQWHIHI